MSVYLVDQLGYDLYINSGVVVMYDEECSCVRQTECNVSCQTPQVDNVSQDALYIIVTTTLLQTAEYEFTFVDNCVISGLIAALGVFDFYAIVVLLAFCFFCSSCGVIGLIIGLALKTQSNGTVRYSSSEYGSPTEV